VASFQVVSGQLAASARRNASLPLASFGEVARKKKKRQPRIPASRQPRNPLHGSAGIQARGGKNVEASGNHVSGFRRGIDAQGEDSTVVRDNVVMRGVRRVHPVERRGVWFWAGRAAVVTGLILFVWWLYSFFS
jgi:hypothetical protein